MSEDFGSSPVMPERVRSFISGLFRNLYYGETFKLKKNYFSDFSQLTDAYFKQEEWPIFEEIEELIHERSLFKDEDEFDIDLYDSTRELFALLYTELCYRHIFLHGKPLLHHRVQSFDNYEALFNLFLASFAEGDEVPNLPLEWVADMMDEFLYQFEDFCSYRHQLEDLPEEDLEELEELKDGLFNVKTTIEVLTNLSSLCDHSSQDKNGTLWNVGYIATLGVSRVHVLTADYRLALASLQEIDLDDRRELFTRLTSVHVTLFYYTGFSYLMMRRYADAVSVFSAILLSHRGNDGHKSRGVCYADSQFQRKYEKIKALCCLAVALNVGSGIEDNLKAILEDGSNNLEALVASVRASEANQRLEIFEEVFQKNCPRFITPQEPNFKQITNRHKETLKIQKKWFLEEVTAQSSTPDIKGFLKMYSTISMEKLSRISGLEEKKMFQALIAAKYRSQQLIRSSDSVSADLSHKSTSYRHESGKLTPVSDIHFFVSEKTINMSEKGRKQKFADFFLQNTLRLNQCTLDLKSKASSGKGKKHKNKS